LRTPLERGRRLRTLLALCAGCGWAASAIVLLEYTRPAQAWPRTLLLIAALVFLPLYESNLTAPFRRRRTLRPYAFVIWVLQVIPILLLPLPLMVAALFGTLVLANGWFFILSDDEQHAIRGIVAAPATAILALGVIRSQLLLVLVPVSLVCALLAAVLLHGRLARGKLRRTRGLPPDPSEERQRLLVNVPVALVTLVVWFGAFALIDTLIRTERELERETSRAAAAPEPEPVRRTGEGVAAGNGSFAPDLTYAGGVLPFGDAEVMWVRAPRALGPLYMRDMVLDTFDERGCHLRDRSLPARSTDRSDGRVDGWTNVAAHSEANVELEVRARRLTVQGSGQALLFSPQRLSGTTIPEIYYAEDHIFVTDIDVDEWFDYRVRYAPSARLEDVGDRRARHPDERFTQLPESRSVVNQLEGYARALAGAAGSDRERVRNIVEHLSNEFTYDVEETGFRGPEAVLSFLISRSGYCTQSAQAAVLLLRRLDISARIATGFVAQEWDADTRSFVVRERNAHAWIEVYFEGVGWITLDPTPADRRSGAEIAAEEYAARNSWLGRVRYWINRWVDGAHEASLGTVLRALFDVPFQRALRQPETWLLLSLCATLVLIALRRRRVRPEAAPLPSAPPAILALEQRLIGLLAGAGFVRSPAQTLRELASVAQTNARTDWRGLDEIVDLLYRGRFSARALGEQETGRIESFLSARAREAGPSGHA